jgi:NDP-sugar pyrophosphorylase family protein
MLNILIPASGQGQRFKDCGYTTPKPFIDVNGETMIQRVISNMTPNKYGHKILIMPLKEWEGKFNISPEIGKVFVDEITKGAANTALLAREYIDTDDPLIIASCDQLVDWNIDDFIEKSKGLDGNLLTFKSDNLAHSFCEVKKGKVVRTAEKEVISDNANVGIYYFGTGRDFVTAAEIMIDKKDTFNDEYYIAKVYNHLIEMGKTNVEIYELPVENVHILGTPTKLREYLQCHIA